MTQASAVDKPVAQATSSTFLRAVVTPTTVNAWLARGIQTPRFIDAIPLCWPRLFQDANTEVHCAGRGGESRLSVVGIT